MNHNFEVKPADKILIVSPHPDDESIGCGGVLSLYGKQCDVWLLTDGARSYDKNFPKQESEKLAKTRRAEFDKAVLEANVNFVKCFSIPEHKIRKNYIKFSGENLTEYSIILVPNRWEAHKDHADAYWLIKKLMRRQGAKALLYEYEVWTTLRSPNARVDISDVTEKKRSLILNYVSQNNEVDYPDMILGLNNYRGCSHTDCRCAEAFYSEQIEKAERKRHIKRKLRGLLKK